MTSIPSTDRESTSHPRPQRPAEAVRVDVDERALSIPAVDGRALCATYFARPDAHDDAPLVIVNGATGVPRRFYARFARELAARGFLVLTYDYRGIGGSRRGHARRDDARMSDWGRKDFEGVIRYAAEALDRPTVRVVGHSVGGQILGLAPSNGDVERAVCVASQLGDYRLWSGAGHLRMLATWRVLFPVANGLLGYVPGWLGIGEDLPPGVAREWRAWCVTKGYFFGDGHGIDRAGFERMRAAMLAISIEADPFAPLTAVDAWASSFTWAHVLRDHLEDAGLGHFGFFRAENRHLWARVADFLA